MTTAEYNQCVYDYSDGLFRFVLKHIRQAADAEDVVQLTFEKCWKRHDTISFEKAKGYLFKAAYSTMIDWIRKNKKHRLAAVDIETAPSFEPGWQVDLNQILNRAIQQLPEVQKTVVLLRDYEGYSYKEIGEITGLKLSQVKVYIFRARKQLQKLLISVEKIV